MLEIKKEIALNAFDSGFNCAQSVLRAFALQFDLDLQQAMDISSGFGGGMGKTQQTCGAVSGAYMLIGMHLSRKISDEEERKEMIVKAIQQFRDSFIEKNGATDCAKLTGVDLNTESGSKAFKDKEVGNKVCKPAIQSSIEILDSIINPE